MNSNMALSECVSQYNYDALLEKLIDKRSLMVLSSNFVSKSKLFLFLWVAIFIQYISHTNILPLLSKFEIINQ